MYKPQLIVTEDGSHTLYVPELKETYHSFHGAWQESEHVFIEKGLNNFANAHPTSSVNLLEIGFGTGLNALLAAAWASKNKVEVRMTSLEAYPIDNKLAVQLNYPEFVSAKEAAHWFEHIHETPWNQPREINRFYTLTKRKIKLEKAHLPSMHFEVVFFDAFAPNKQSELWEMTILQKIYNTQTVGSFFVTYCAKGQLKRDLRDLGYDVETLDGPPGKKEMIRATKL
ncbi:MAG: tRNA (5-methylaminomethyl-2-thiouridine)(34)-methyltransferase MnmD [Bacteroidota bacterium]